jgi:hypothetical protein
MSKYAALKNHLHQAGLGQVRMSFRDIEHVLGFDLPSSARRHRAWWSNNASNNVMTHAWLDAGYVTEDVDMAGGQVTFVARRSPASGGHGFAGLSGSFASQPASASGQPRPLPHHQILSGPPEDRLAQGGPPSDYPAAREAGAVLQRMPLRPGTALSSAPETGLAELVEAGLPDRTWQWLRDAAPTQEGRAAMIIDAIEAMAARSKRVAILDRYSAETADYGPAMLAVTRSGGSPAGPASDSADLIREDRDGR